MESSLPRDDLLVEKQLSNLLHVVLVLRQEVFRSLVSGNDHFADFGIEHLARLLTEGLRPALPRTLTTTVADWADDVVHTVVRTRFERHLRDLLKVVLGTRRNVLCAKEDFLGNTAAEGHAYTIHHLWC